MRRAEQRRQRPGGLLGPEQVVGQLGVGALGAGGGQGRVGLERLGHRAVQPQPLARQQLGVHRLLQQRVPEAVAVGVHDQRLVLDRGAQSGRPLGRRHRRDPLEEPVVDLPADQRGHARSTSCASAGSRSTRTAKMSRRVGGTLAAVADGHQLLDEERVALGAEHELVHELDGQVRRRRWR